jgi:glycosyltransferase involved in cell wall biosynthesis
MKDRPLVSIIVPTCNSERFVERCLRSLRAQTYGNIEIIVVDKYSTDATRNVARKFADLVLLKGPERSAQVNYGTRYACGEFIYRVDSDVVLEPSVVEEAVTKCEVDGFDAVCVHNASDPNAGFWSKVRQLERDCYIGDKLNVAARFFRKEVFLNVGGFNERLVAAEDYDLHNRLIRYRSHIGYIKSKEIHLGEPSSLAEVARKHYFYGKTIMGFLRANRERGFKQVNPVRPAFLRNLRSFAKHPTLAFGFVVYQLVRYSSAALGALTKD